jgi:peptidyl-prolyl cis-trans isomerase B (cyclophilin B)
MSLEQPTPPSDPQPYGQQPPPYGQPYGQQFGQQPPPYGQPYGWQPQPYRRTNPLAIAALVASFFVWPAGLVLSIIASKQIKASGEDGRGLAQAGLIISIVYGAFTVLYIGAWILFMALGVGMTMFGTSYH